MVNKNIKHADAFRGREQDTHIAAESKTCMQVPSDQNIPFNEKPAMQSQKITQLAIDALKSGKYDQVRINFPNPDMVGHTGDLDATISACTTVDTCVKVRLRLCQLVLRKGRKLSKEQELEG